MPRTTNEEQWQEYRVTPRYLAGSGGTGDAGFAPVAHWPHQYLDDGPCQLLVTSPDGRIRIGWFGDDFALWKITAAEDAVSAPLWTATFNHVTPPEIVAGLTRALANDYAEAEPAHGTAPFLSQPSLYWADAIQPLIAAGWTPQPAERGTVEIISPDRQAGARIDNRLSGWDDENLELWAGPPSWSTRAEALFTARTPTHLIAATAAAMADPIPVIRERHMLHPTLEPLIHLVPVTPTGPQPPRAPTPLDVRRTSVTQALDRAAHAPQTTAQLRIRAARSRTPLPKPTGPSGPEPATEPNPPTNPPNLGRRR